MQRAVRVITFVFTVNGNQSFIADQDYELIGVHGSANQAIIVNYSGNIDVGNILTGPTPRYDILKYNVAGAALTETKIPIDEGSTVYVYCAGASAVFLYLALPASAETPVT